MFAYCGNNPIVRKDSGGQFWHIVGGAAIGAAAGVLTKMVTNMIAKEDSVFSSIGTAALAGTISGGLAASGVGIVGQVVGNAGIAMANNGADQLIAGTEISDINIGSIVVDGVIGAMAGFAGGPGAGKEAFLQGLSYFGKNARHMMKPLAEAVAKSSATVILTNGTKAMLN